MKYLDLVVLNSSPHVRFEKLQFSESNKQLGKKYNKKEIVNGFMYRPRSLSEWKKNYKITKLKWKDLKKEIL